ncbi:hypothetical protein NC653_026643 [Populus alba x Populus x berolinensis]|uniref:Uncharacterized protein n=1 Tax=Populus alba x Populus x berolinensis TaxID=444605 RepID=A0AAD6ME74_9ROSI|nr:hypothetical protein NC653_026643 [Populus alba x Populus x berolinensis]
MSSSALPSPLNPPSASNSSNPFSQNNISRIQSLPHDSNKITLPDGTVKEGKRWQSSPKEKSRRILGRVWLRMR